MKRFSVDQVLDVPLQDGATYVRGTVIAADDDTFLIRLETRFRGRVVEYLQDTHGVRVVADG